MSLPKKTAQTSENSTPSRRTKTKDNRDEKEAGKESITETNAKKPADSDKAVKIPPVEKKQCSPTKVTLVVHSGFDDQFRQKVPSGLHGAVDENRRH